ncbi:ribosome biogenesis GTPase YlqF [Mycoplasmopsis columbinasalis]|uniref:Ribosome biogenesis GTPase A n=1 Tax=Mycoplasmopsis columbinasalis TaxID=114880 RepID=A0A449BAE2_9BACT|nr:ribosome biogenesis GTPase YlqF [Mycoplasmopsis columbinasalis]VEU78162.1 GTPase [Mycoplasmopsis columbinasalis]
MNNTEQTLINWYPGHMTKGMREIKENASLADVFIMVLDARCPISSYNEDFDAIAPQKPRLFVITKSDLMDDNKKNLIQKRFGNEQVLWLDLRKKSSRDQIIKAIKKCTREKVERDKQKGFLISKIKVFVVGVPNAGKSSLINLISQKQSLKVANMPGITRAKKWVAVDNIYFMDTPGILLPKLTDQKAAVKLAMVGSIETTIFPLRFLANQYLKTLAEYYPEKIEKEFNVDLTEMLSQEFTDTVAYNVFANMAVNKNFKINNKPDFNKIYVHFINWVKNLKGVTYD